MKRLLVCIVLIFTFFGSLVAQKYSEAPLNPDYVKYLELKKAGKWKNQTSKGYPLGGIPSPVNFATQKNIDEVEKSFPPTYDLRNVGGQCYLTPVQNQNPCGCCNAFATTSTVESYLLWKGIGEYNFSENHIKQYHGFENEPCEGGSTLMMAAYLMRGSGLIDSVDAPYYTYDYSTYNGKPPIIQMTDWVAIPKGLATIKDAILNYGGLYVTMHFEEQYYDEDTYTYMYLGEEPINHVVTLIGWNDNMETQASNPGAWIIKNSWGTNWPSDDGYFYVSYFDSKINDAVAYFPGFMHYDPNRIISYYDTLGFCGMNGFNSTTCYALVKFTANQSFSLESIGTYGVEDNTLIDIQIYETFENNSLEGLLGESLNNQFERLGFHKLDLVTPITINSGNDYYVKILYQTPNLNIPLPVEVIKDTTANPHIENGIFWISPDGTDWELVGAGTEHLWDPCVKVYGTAIDTDTLRNIVDVEYFFNEDPGFGNGTSIPIVPAKQIENINLTLDISTLNYGFNHLYVRAKDDLNRWSLTNIKSFYKETVFTSLPNTTKVEYFIDEDPGEGNGINIPVSPSPNIGGIDFIADVSDYPNGFHHLYVRTKDARGNWSLTNIKSFYKETVFTGLPNITKVEYFIDEDPGEGNGTEIPVSPAPNIGGIDFIADVSGYPNGFHHLYVRAKDSRGNWGLTNIKSFYKETVFTSLPNITKVEYFIDEDPGEGNGTEIPVSPSTNIGGIDFIADVSGYPNGFHHLYVRAKDTHGNWSLTNIKSFYKETVFTDLPNITKVEYFIDEDPGEGNGIEIPVSPSPNIRGINFIADISEYPNGFHHLYVRSKDARGNWSLTNIKSFYKETIYTEAQSIVKAEYFFNEDPGEGNGMNLPLTPAPNIQDYTFIADVYDLPLGENKLFVRVMDENNRWSLTNIETLEVQCAMVTVDFGPEEGCATMPLEFTDLSTHVHPLAEYRWYFGDGTPVVITGVGNYTHTYQATGEYEVNLVIKSREDCIDSITKNVTIHEPPVVFAGEDQTVCEGDEVILTATYSNGTLSWNHNVTNGVPFIATQTTTYTATSTSIYGCGPVTDHVVVTVVPLPVVFAGEDATGCANESFVINSTSAENYSSLSWQAVNGSGYFNNPGQLTTIYNPAPSDPQVVTVCLSAEPLSPCTLGMADCFDLTLTKPPTVTIQEPLNGATICASTEVQLMTTVMHSAGVSWTSSGDGTFANATQPNSTYFPGSLDIANGQVTLCLEAQPLSGCTLSVTDCITLNIQPDPQIILNPDFWLDCENYDFDLEQWLPYQMSATVENAASLEWNTNGDGYFDDPTNLFTNYHLGDEDILNGEVMLSHSASGPDQCNLTITEQCVLHIPGQLIPVPQTGWRGISSYMDNASKTVPEVLAPVVNSLAIIMDEANNSYNPATGVNTIGNWGPVGYRASFTSSQACLPVYGDPVSSKIFEIQISPTFLPVLTDSPVYIEDLFNGHLDQIEQIYDWSTFQSWTPGNAGFYELKPGFAYSLVTTSDFTIEFPPFSWEDPVTEVVITGKILNETNGEPVENVEIMVSGQSSVFTDDLGNFAIAVPFGWSGEIIPVKNEWEFWPPVINLENAVVNIYDQDFQGVTTACDPGWEVPAEYQPHTIAIPLSANPDIFGEPLETDDWIGVFYLDDNSDEQCGGSVQWSGNANVSIDACGDDPTTQEKDGFAFGEEFRWKIYDCSSQETFTAFASYDPYLPHQGAYSSWGISALTGLECQFCQEIQLLDNWNDVSLFVDPLNPDVESIFAPMVNDLVIFRNLNSVFWPDYSINTVGDWNTASGYVLKVEGSHSLQICGSPLEGDLSFSASESSWHYLPVLSSCLVEADQLFSPEVNNITIVKDLIGAQVWWPQMGIYSLDELIPGQAYEIKISDNITLSFPACSKSGTVQQNQIQNTVESGFGEIKFTPVTHTIAFPAGVLQDLPRNCQIGVFNDNGKIYGLFPGFTGKALAVIANGDDPATQEIDGFIEGEMMYFRIIESKAGTDTKLSVGYDNTLPNTGYFTNHGLSAITNIEFTGVEDLAMKPLKVDIHPNPSSGVFNVNLNEGTPVNGEVYDIHGVCILELRNQINDFAIDLSAYPKGIYYLKIEQGGLQDIRKLVLQ